MDEKTAKLLGGLFIISKDESRSSKKYRLLIVEPANIHVD
jgi:hypothetical protein